MKRVLAIGVVISLANASAAVAGETLLGSATRMARELGATETVRTAEADQAKRAAAKAGVKTQPQQKVNFQQGQRGLESSGLRTRSKLLIGLGVAAGFAGIALAIDSRVEDVTPSTKGERTTDPF